MPKISARVGPEARIEEYKCAVAPDANCRVTVAAASRSHVTSFLHITPSDVLIDPHVGSNSQ